jgi:hypothetical protein
MIEKEEEHLKKIASVFVGLSEVNFARRYSAVIDRLSYADKKILFEVIVDMREMGVDEVAHRVVDDEGKSAVFSTSLPWLQGGEDSYFFLELAAHMDFEIPFVKRSGFKYLSRSKDKINTPYTRILDEFKLNNSIMRFNFLNDKVEIFYFLPSFNYPEKRDLILNNIPQLEYLINKIDHILKFISNSREFKASKRQILSRGAIEEIFQPIKKEQTGGVFNVFLNNQKVNLTQREFNCLSVLKTGCTNKIIANTLGISEHTAKDNIESIKQKCFIGKKKTLVTLLMDNKIVNIYGKPV